jgi:hypothetical protein
LPEEGQDTGQKKIRLDKGLRASSWIEEPFFIGKDAKGQGHIAEKEEISERAGPSEKRSHGEQDRTHQHHPFQEPQGSFFSQGNRKGFGADNQIALDLENSKKADLTYTTEKTKRKETISPVQGP